MKLLLATSALVLGACGAPPEHCATSNQLARVCGQTMLKGIDVSVYQGTIDWAKVAATGVAFAFARVSDGPTHVDTQFAANWPHMRAAGVVRGVYQYFRAGSDPTIQADLVVDQMTAAGGLLDDDLPPVLDFETVDGQSNAVAVANAQTWLDRIEARTRRRPIVYSGNNMAAVTGTHFSSYPLWVPNYTTMCPLVPAGWTEWLIWQNSGSGAVNGITGAVDTDFWNGTPQDLSKFIVDSHLDMPDLGGDPVDAATADDAGPVVDAPDLAPPPCR